MSELKPGLEERYESVRNTLKLVEEDNNLPPNTVFLLPISKTFDTESLKKGILCGMNAFGENYVQEACEKIDFFKENYPEIKLTWHFVGHLQSNKTKLVAERFDWVQTVDSFKIARRLSEQRPKTMPVLNVLIEVNISGQKTKSGVNASEVEKLINEIKSLPNLRVRGLMAIPQPSMTHEEKLKPLKAMKTLFDQLNQKGFDLDTLSMGMSADMREAVECGSTMVRVGTAIFGPRDYSNK